MSDGDVGAEVAAVLAAHRAIVFGDTDGWWVVCTCGYREHGADTTIHVADALAPLIAARVEAAKAEALLPFEELFDGGPDTACRTVWRQNDGMGHGEVEYVEVPMDDLRDAFARAAALDPGARP